MGQKKWLLQYEFDLSELGDKHRYIGSASVIGTFLSSHQIERGLSKRKKEVLCVSCLPHITDTLIRYCFPCYLPNQPGRNIFLMCSLVKN